MGSLFNVARLIELVRFYQAALVNAAFGFGLYLIFIRMGLNIYLAQILSHVMGMAFNYFTYSHHVFRGAAPAKLRFAATYTINYFIGLGLLFIGSYFIKSPYLLGFIILVLVSVINYIFLKNIVFVKKLTL
ncbi:MAG: hypothetical protein B7Y43_15980 [Sphingomonas sp. 28-62-20]|uniref:GtrA family protein n=1 Tax=Sphingomonas sp. 28-62-20 TaxID=1970433 RepID=UPI000BC6FEFC|nr:MAG: hypothetical protein B7Y43_15980 [Sphingomonas sp. 28-62-20]